VASRVADRPLVADLCDVAIDVTRPSVQYNAPIVLARNGRSVSLPRFLTIRPPTTPQAANTAANAAIVGIASHQPS
jgi:hypothetical protein